MYSLGIFDSGVGGLGIFKSIAQQLPGQDIIYFADSKNLPFGQKTTEQLHQITGRILHHLIVKHDIKLAVIACNTASVSSLLYLRQKFSIPIVGAVPVVKPACELSIAKKVAILATPHTTNSEYQKQLIAQYGKGVEVLSIACPDLVGLIETGLFDDVKTQDKLREYLTPAIDAGVDVVGLACTHYPFLKTQIQRLLPPGVMILDSNDAVAKQVVKVHNRILEDKVFDKSVDLSEKVAKYSFFVTKQPEQFQLVTQKLLGEMFKEVTLISL